MSDSPVSPADLCRRTVGSLAHRPLLADAGGHVRLALGDGPIPRLVAWTHEDKAAKGLRKLAPGAEPQPPVHFSVAEMLQDCPALLLVAEAGAGRTTLARDLALRFAGARLGHPRFGLWPADAALDRNDRGDALPQAWTGPAPVPVLLCARAGATLAELLAEAGLPGLPEEPAILILDDLEQAGAGALVLLRDALALQAASPHLRLLALADEAEAADWIVPAGWTRLALLPLLVAQRRRFAADHAGVLPAPSPAALGGAAAHASLFALALAAPGQDGSAEDLAASWLAAAAAAGRDAEALGAAALAALADGGGPPVDDGAGSRRVRQLLAAHVLAGREPADLAARLAAAPARMAPVAASVLRIVDGARRDAFVAALCALGGEAGERAALLAATAVGPDAAAWPALQGTLAAIIGRGTLTPRLREQAGRLLARHGDPRDLEALASVPGGPFTMGASHPAKAAPPHGVRVEPFRIGIYPVTNGQYARFVAETGRPWRSPERDRPERRSAPATDVTWRDARAYCDWLTARWRAEGRLAPGERVRLATEPEWERAARGDQPDGGEAVVYPWAGPWNPIAVNGEDTGFNDTCTVGLFPAGRSPYGCLDMAGQVWEWTSTLWGEDMATPSFAYPYADDGREDAGAGPAVRRVLRGGCFSSGAPKACCTYRGSLEPDGFWRGNGFRIVVAADGFTASGADVNLSKSN